jgi:hypothetical protein
VKRHREEIEELAHPVLGPDGEPAPGAMVRLAVATAVTLPTSAILFEDGLRGMDEAFTARVVERLGERLRAGTSVVFASRRAEALDPLCDEVIVLDGGTTVAGGAEDDAAGGAVSAQPAGRPRPVKGMRAPFHPAAGLISVEVQRGDGIRSKQIQASEDLAIAIRVETVVPDTEVRCGVCFNPRSGETGVRIEHPEPLRLRDPGAYTVLARVPAGTLPSGGYRIHADAVVATGPRDDANAISRNAGRLRIVGDHPVTATPATPPVEHWDGCVARPADAEWSIQ